MKRFAALATDYDGTIAEGGVVATETAACLMQVKASGRRLILVSGRTQDCFDGKGPSPLCFSGISLFDVVVAEDGATMYFPSSGKAVLLAPPVRTEMRSRLASSGIEPLWIGACMISTTSQNAARLEAILGSGPVRYRPENNRSWVMFNPAGVSKASGLRAALRSIGVSPSRTVGMGDSYNDIPFLRLCGISFAVGDADQPVRQIASCTTSLPGPAGARQVLQALINNDLHSPSLGTRWTDGRGAA